MTQSIQKLAVLFADICGSTALYESLGDVLARRLIARCIATMTGEIPPYKGTVVKTIGDEIMCTFPDAGSALNAACAMQRAVKNSTHGSSQPMHIRIGFHYGDVICESGDVFGDTANVAAHVAKITRANQILATKAVIDVLPPDLQLQARRIMRSDFKGKQEQFDIYMITYGAEDMESTRIGIPAYRKTQEEDSDSELVLRYRDQSCMVNKRHRTAILGRENTCQIVVRNDFASRQHVRIEFRLGKFIIIDQSTNGTFIRYKSGDMANITRNEMILEGSGSISLGQSFSEQAVDPVEFSVFPDKLQRK
jgi:class 3 adenylate cyclase